MTLGPWLEEIWRDLRFAIRSLGRTPGFTSIALLVIAVGIGVNIAVFSVVNAVLLKPLTYPDAQTLVRVVTIGNRGPIPVATISEHNEQAPWEEVSGSRCTGIGRCENPDLRSHAPRLDSQGRAGKANGHSAAAD